jgi:HD-GYP domain-containing protein (c-di-GMP phosphodiesterase class II)
MSGVSLRVRVAMVVALAAILCALVMGLLGLHITRTRVEDVAAGAALDVASLLATDLAERGLTPDRLTQDPALQAIACEYLEAKLELLNPAGLLWTNASILQPAGERWLVLARADSSGSDRVIRGPGDTLKIEDQAPFHVPSCARAVAGRFRTELNEWFGASVPLGTRGDAGSAPGVVTLTMHRDDAKAYMQDVLQTALIALGISIVVGVALGWWSAGVIVRPIEQVRAFAGRLGRREYATRVEERGAPEIRGLLRDMNQLAEDLSQRDARLLKRMARMAETRDPKETGAHVLRVSSVSLELLEGWLARHPMSPREAAFARETLESAAVLHDVGKVGVSDLILKKPGKLDDSEYAAMKRHSILGAALLPGDDAYDKAAREVALRHHERWDGKGYPGAADTESAHGEITQLLEVSIPAGGLAGADIPLFARIVSIADVFDALSSRRSYKDPWPEEKVLQTIRDESGKAFDPELVEIFVERFEQVKAAWARHPDPDHHA